MPADSCFFFGPLPSASGCSLGVVGELNKGRFMHQAGDCGQLATNLCEQLPHVATQLQVSTDALEVRISTSRCLGISGHDHQDIKKLLFLESTSCANASRSMNFDYPLLAWGMQEGPCGSSQSLSIECCSPGCPRAGPGCVMLKRPPQVIKSNTRISIEAGGVLPRHSQRITWC